MITVSITATNYSVTATSQESSVQVSSDNVLFTITNQVSSFEIINTPSPTITFLTEGAGFDFAVKHRGEWTLGATYTRNDVVRYQYSIYINTIEYLDELISSVSPNLDTANWELFVFNEWPRAYLTITNTLAVGGLTTLTSGVNVGDLTAGRVVYSGASGRLKDSGAFTYNESTGLLTVPSISINQVNATTATFDDLTVNDNFYINGLRYPSNLGNYGQVLVTNGTNQAQWLNLGDLVFWNLSGDLQTNGFNIVTGYNPSVPNPQLTIGSGVTGNFSSYIRFEEGSSEIEIEGPTSFNDSVTISSNLTVNQSLGVDQNLRVNGLLRADTNTTPVDLEYGIKFPDGTVLTTAAVGTGTSIVPIATANSLGVIRVGNYLTIQPDTGILSVDTASLPGTYTLPKASASVLGGVKIGSGLEMTGPNLDILIASSTATYGSISLTENLLTNGYKITYGSAQANSSYLDVNSSDIDIKSSLSRIELKSQELSLSNTNQISLLAPINVVGSDIYNSRLQVSRIYNFAGVGPPLFPAGTQYGDQTVQLTAYVPDDMGPIFGGTMLANGVDFNNLTFAVDYNL